MSIICNKVLLFDRMTHLFVRMSDVSMKLGIETAKCESLVRYLIMNECGENVFVVKGEKTCPFMANIFA